MRSRHANSAQSSRKPRPQWWLAAAWVRATTAMLVAFIAVVFAFATSNHAGSILGGMFVWILFLSAGVAINWLDAVGRSIVTRWRRAIEPGVAADERG